MSYEGDMKEDMKSGIFQTEAVSLWKKRLPCCFYSPGFFCPSSFLYISGCMMIEGKLQCDLNIGHVSE